MANPKPDAAETPLVDTRGQITVTLAAAEYVLRPTFEAIQAAERLIAPLTELTHLAAAQRLTIDQMATLCAEFMKAHGKTLAADDPTRADHIAAKPERLAKLIYNAGSPKVNGRLTVLLLGALSGGYDAEGESTAPAAKTKAETAAGA